MITPNPKFTNSAKGFLTPKSIKLIQLTENAPVGLFQISKNGYFNIANEEAKKILKKEGYDVFRTNIFDYLDSKSAKEFRQKIKIAGIDEKLIFDFFLEEEEEDFNYQITLTPGFNKEEQIENWFGAIYTIPFLEKERSLSLDQLEDLKKSHEQIKNQLAHLCHEVRIPINTIMGMSYLLAENIDEETKKEFLEPLFSSADFLEKLVSSILDHSKMDEGHMELYEENYSLSNELNQIQKAFEILLKDKPVEFILENGIEEDLIYGDALRLKQILSNLLNNACKFTSQGKIGIRTLLHPDKYDRPMARFEVWDTGIGIPSHKLETVFDAYRQADTQIASKYGGTGLGLSIVQQLIKLHGGQINIKSIEGEGTTFIVDIPFKTQEPEAIQVLPLENFDKINLMKGKRILVFEDNLMERKLIQRLFQDWECQYKIIQNGIIDTQKIQEEDYDLILMDINLPEKNGYEITKELRASGIDIPIIALTGSIFPDDQRKASESGMNGFISKPYTFADLEAIVNKWI